VAVLVGERGRPSGDAARVGGHELDRLAGLVPPAEDLVGHREVDGGLEVLHVGVELDDLVAGVVDAEALVIVGLGDGERIAALRGDLLEAGEVAHLEAVGLEDEPVLAGAILPAWA
jgi:hypothetical protein